MVAKSTGRCLCGAVRFVAHDVETHHSACHCATCRRWSGGSPLFTAGAKSVEFEGEANITRYSSSEWAERGFCKTCGSNLFYFLRPMEKYMISVGAFDDASAFVLAREIYIDKKPTGYELGGDRPRMTEAEVIAAFAPPPK